MTPEELDLLIDDYLDGRLSAEQRDIFERDLLADPAALDRLIAAGSVHRLLQDRYAAQSREGLHTLIDAVADDAADPDGSSVMELVVDQALAERRRHEVENEAERLLAKQQAEVMRERQYRIRRAMQSQSDEPVAVSKLGVLLAAAAMLGLIAWLGWPEDQPDDRTSHFPDPIVQPEGEGVTSPADPAERVAVIRSSVDARWIGRQHDRDGGLSQGRSITLLEGLAEVVFDDGAAVILQGPATFEPTGTNGLRLVTGKLSATVPPSALGFTVQTPGGLITDYGTEFGVIVNHDGQTLAQTFSGRIGLAPSGGGDEVQLLAGDAVISTTSGSVRDARPEPMAFVRETEYAARRDVAPDAYTRWLAYSYELRRDPDVVVYYTFEPEHVSGRGLRNASAGRDAPSYDATFAANRAAPGRFSEKPAFGFAGDGEYVEATLDRALPAATLAGWYWIDEMAGSFASLLHTSGIGNDGGIHWHINTNHGQGWAIEFVQQRRRIPQPGYWYDALAPGLQPQAMTGRWVHLALCYDHDAGDAVMYVDGQAVVRSTVDDGIPIRLGEFRLGNWYAPVEQRHNDWPRPLRGRVDEFVVIGRALSDAEVAAMYAAGMPDN